MSHFNLQTLTFFFRKLFNIFFIVVILFFVYIITVKSFHNKTRKVSASSTLINRLEHPYPAPPIANISMWINSKPLQLSDLKGKVVLIDFWTYSCINCIRTFSYLKDWYEKYHDKGFEIIGIHSPEFAFEHKMKNVKHAIVKYGIQYPIALDNHFTTWDNFHNEYWPAHFLINQKGEVVYEHFGEGEYDVTENNIRYLLGLNEPQQILVNDKYSPNQTAELYLGYDRAKNFSNSNLAIKNKVADYHFPESLPTHQWALAGKWIIYPDKIVAASAGAEIKLHFYAGKVHAVMGSVKKPVHIKLLLNGKLVALEKGKDMRNSQVNVVHNQLYSLINLEQEKEAILEVKAIRPGLEIYAFTFGS